jgi:hypothetical protein
MQKFVKIGSSGEQLPADAKDWVAVLDTSTNLMWDRHESSKEMTHAAAEKHAAKLDVAGFNDWRQPTRVELFGITDDTRYNPAINTDFFDSHGDWVWTSSPGASDPAFAWCVLFFRGGVDSSTTATTSAAFARCARPVSNWPLVLLIP